MGQLVLEPGSKVSGSQKGRCYQLGPNIQLYMYMYLNQGSPSPFKILIRLTVDVNDKTMQLLSIVCILAINSFSALA